MAEVDKKSVEQTETGKGEAKSGQDGLTRKINALKNVQYKMVEIEAKFYEELHQLECKYAQLYEPYYQQRKKIVNGDHEPTNEEAKWHLDEADDAEKSATTNGKGEEDKELHESGKKLLADLKKQFGDKKDEKGVPNFWLETLQSFRITAEIIQEHDEPILAYLQDIRVRLFNEKPYGYTLEFEFAENPYFTNKVLTKTYELKTEVDEKDPFSFEGPDLNKATGCKIDWKAGKNVTVKLTKKKLKPRNKKTPPKVITKEEKQDSFFNFFETPKGQKSGDDSKKVRPADDEDEDENDDEGNEELYMIADFEIGQYLREKVIPKAILYYTGELDGLDDEYDDEYEDGDEDDEDGEEEDEDDDDDDDDDDEDDEEDHKKGGKKGGKGGAKGAKGSAKAGAKGGEANPPECKQN